MGLLCCFGGAQATAGQKQPSTGSLPVQHADAPPGAGAAAAAAGDGRGPALAAQAPAAQQKDVDKPWSKLNENESAAVKQTLLKVRLYPPTAGVLMCLGAVQLPGAWDGANRLPDGPGTA